MKRKVETDLAWQRFEMEKSQQVQDKLTNPLGANNTDGKVTDNSSSNGGDPFRPTN